MLRCCEAPVSENIMELQAGATIENEFGNLAIHSSCRSPDDAGTPQCDDLMNALQGAFGDVLPTCPFEADSPQCNDEELQYWDCFAKVYQQEVNYQQKVQGKELSKEQRQQILADVLVWAEVTQQHYDDNTASFVTSPHAKDEQFQRVGVLFRQEKMQHHLQ